RRATRRSQPLQGVPRVAARQPRDLRVWRVLAGIQPRPLIRTSDEPGLVAIRTRRLDQDRAGGRAPSRSVGAGRTDPIRGRIMSRSPLRPANRVTRRRGKLAWRNWAGSQASSPTEFRQPESESAIVEVVEYARTVSQPLKVVGAGHSWSGVACTDGILLNLDRHRDILAIDADAGTVTVEAGIRLEDLNTALARSGLGLPVLGSVSAQSIAGAISTGTHGSGARFGNLASAVRALRLVTADGRVLELDAASEPELFSAARIGLGALGVVS